MSSHDGDEGRKMEFCTIAPLSLYALGKRELTTIGYTTQRQLASAVLDARVKTYRRLLPVVLSGQYHAICLGREYTLNRHSELRFPPGYVWNTL